MQEKRLRRQELEEQARASPEAAPQKDPAQEKSSRKNPTGVSLTSGSPSPPPTATQAPPPAVTSALPTVTSTGKLPVRKLISLKSKAALVGNGETPAAGAAVCAAATTSLPANQSSALKKQKQTDADAPSQAKRARMLSQGGAADVPDADKTAQKSHLSSQVKGTTAPQFIYT